MSADGVLPETRHSTDARRKYAISVVHDLRRDVDFEDVFCAATVKLAQTHHQEDRARAVMALVNRDRSTVIRWIKGETKPSAIDAWQVVFVPMLAGLEPEVQDMVAQSLRDILNAR
jgi:hypothetical protein